MYKKFSTRYVYDKDVDSGGGGDDGKKTEKVDKPEGVDYKKMYLDLTQKIENGEYVEKSSYTTLQRKLQEKSDALTELTKEKDALAGQIQTLSGEKDTLIEEKTAWTDKETELNTQLKSSDEKYKRLQTIVKDYPELLRFEMQENGSLLPQVPLDELPEALKGFADALGEMKTEKKVEEQKGGLDEVPKKKEKNTTADTLKSEMNAALAKGDITLYEEKREAYFKARGITEDEEARQPK